MAEQFLSKLTNLEEKIDGLGETLKRMVTILSEVTEIKSEIRIAKDEILDSIKNSISASPPSVEPQENIAEQMSGEFSKIQDMITGIQEQMDSKIQELIEPRFQQFQEEVRALILSTSAQAAPVAVGLEKPTASEAAPAVSTASISASKSMKIAEHLQTILDSLRMGCKAGDVLDTIAESRDNISKLVEADPITVKIDEWTSEVGKTRRRKELKARDILKIKKELRKEIKKYSPA